MFQPFNESFVRSTVETTIDRHMGESEEERALREGKSYQPSHLRAQAHELLHACGRLLFGTAKRFENNNRRAPLVQQRGTTH